ncbi:nucleoside phosphorylase [Enterovibrio coralii]|uniref:Uridine phosphorylase n=1 Tax=Enterovibrio coralii TaxID=294935 RepID=A0A135I7S1_9GAMM|nr:nucleoside phosphorylase [Enterovibrio coralii]KXF81478.1 uridine phosphorylase [Enterovibrio coralii]
MKQPHICVDETQVSERVVLCGDPARADRIADLLEDKEFLAENREYRLFKGTFQGKDITVSSCGIGAPSLIIALEELRLCGAKSFIRVGSCGAIQHGIGLGELILAEGAVRDEGGSHAYVSATYPALASFELVGAMANYLNAQNKPFYSGIVRSHDSFYRDDELEICHAWNKKGVLGCDMETSALFTVGRLRGLRTAAVLNNVVLFEEDISEGIAQYVDSESATMEGETLASLAALHALTAQ